MANPLRRCSQRLFHTLQAWTSLGTNEKNATSSFPVSQREQSHSLSQTWHQKVGRGYRMILIFLPRFNFFCCFNPIDWHLFRSLCLRCHSANSRLLKLCKDLWYWPWQLWKPNVSPPTICISQREHGLSSVISCAVDGMSFGAMASARSEQLTICQGSWQQLPVSPATPPKTELIEKRLLRQRLNPWNIPRCGELPIKHARQL